MTAAAIEAATYPAPVADNLSNMRCPLCRRETVPLDLLGLLIAESGRGAHRQFNLILQCRANFGYRAAPLLAAAQAKAAVILLGAVELRLDDTGDSNGDPFL